MSVTNASGSGDLTSLSAGLLRETVSAGNINLDAINVTTAWNIVLPLKFTSFTYQQSGKENILKWSTSDEINADRFEVERSYNAINLSSTGNVAAGNKPGKNDYQFTDYIQNASTYYRLKSLDKDGRFIYSKILAVNNTNIEEFKVKVNPVISR
ncbi:MAG: type sorting protein, partial [Chitinophagaceae bacterium]|nr:type sorting protein [Chitinophagaceae bacterium]